MKKWFAGSLAVLAMVALSGCRAPESAPVADQPLPSVTVTAPVPSPTLDELALSIYRDENGVVTETVSTP